jgi:CheY-like chemotaxis protein
MEKHVLVVDDNLLVLCVVADILEEMGLYTYRAGDGTEAIAILETAAPVDLVITDVIMHEVSGVDVFRAARRRAPSVPVVFITGYPADLLADIRSEARMKIVYKPFSIADLQIAVAAVMA